MHSRGVAVKARARWGLAVSEARTFSVGAAAEDADDGGKTHMEHNGTKEMELATE